MSTWTDHIFEEDTATPEMGTYGDRHDQEDITRWRDTAAQALQDMLAGDRPVEFSDESWMEGAAETPDRWAVVRRDDELAIEWATGKHSWAWVDAVHVIGRDAESWLLENEVQ